MIDYKTLPLTTVLFTHLDPKTGIELNLAVDMLLADRKVKLLPMKSFAIDADWAKRCMSDRGVEKHRLSRLLDVKDEFDPIYCIHYGDGSQLQIEGVHRYVASWMLHRRYIRVKIIPLTVWKPYQITGLPKAEENFHQSFSGIK